MATNFPTSADDFATTSPTNLPDDDSTGRTHSERHNDMESAMEAVQGAFYAQTYTPALTAVTTNPTLGTSSVAEGRYWVVGKLVFVDIAIQFGTSGTNAGSGQYRVSFPPGITPRRGWLDAAGWHRGMGVMRDSSAATTQIVTVLDSGDDSGLMLLRYGASVAEHNLPWAWGASDGIYLNLRFEID